MLLKTSQSPHLCLYIPIPRRLPSCSNMRMLKLITDTRHVVKVNKVPRAASCPPHLTVLAYSEVRCIEHDDGYLPQPNLLSFTSVTLFYPGY